MIELIGLAGSGKSTTLKLINKKDTSIHSEYTFTIKDLTFKIFLKSFFNIFLILILSRNIKLTKEYITFHIFKNKIKKQKHLNNICLDQGPIFTLIKLTFELPYLKNFFLKDLKIISSNFNHVIFLNAPTNVLYDRINTRNQNHRIKGFDFLRADLFLSEYNYVFNLFAAYISDLDIEVTQISTSELNINEVAEKVFKIYKRY